jgi:hypothetical protein
VDVALDAPFAVRRGDPKRVGAARDDDVLQGEPLLNLLFGSAR